MPKKNKCSVKEKYLAVQAYLAGEANMPTLGKKYGVNKRTIRRWIDKFERNGYKGLNVFS